MKKITASSLVMQNYISILAMRIKAKRKIKDGN